MSVLDSIVKSPFENAFYGLKDAQRDSFQIFFDDGSIIHPYDKVKRDFKHKKKFVHFAKVVSNTLWKPNNGFSFVQNYCSRATNIPKIIFCFCKFFVFAKFHQSTLSKYSK